MNAEDEQAFLMKLQVQLSKQPSTQQRVGSKKRPQHNNG